MKPHYLRITSLLLSVLVLFALGIVWIADVDAQPHPRIADFQAPYAPGEAAARLAVAQSAPQPPRMAELAAAAQASQLPFVPTVYFSPSGHHLSNRSGFLDFWRANGQLLIFGYPITEEIIENGRVVQYFERARFEYFPEMVGTPFQVQLGLVGKEVLTGDMFTAVPDPMDGTPYFGETGHTLYGEFLGFWEKHGGLATFGFPVSEEYADNGRIIQYFERARFEYFPEDMDGFYRSMEYSGILLNTLYEVRLTDLGRWLVQARGIDTSSVPQIAGAPEWSPALWERHIEVNLSTQWLTAYEDGLPVYYAPVATGRDGFNTPAGNFAVYYKTSMQDMRGSAGGETWYVPNIPWVMYVVGGVALHGTYWHNAFGTGERRSHGCINLGMDDAQWLYEWADIGTSVSIHY